MRAFIAAPLPPAVAAALGEAQRELARSGADVRWTPIPSMHLTLKFLGEAAAEAAEPLARALEAATAGRPPLRLEIAEVGAFPNLRAPRVIRCDLAGDLEGLSALARALDDACARLGFPSEVRPFHPHLTLGRVRSARNLRPLVDCITMRAVAPRGAFEIDRIHLYRSTLRTEGAVHDLLETARLGRPAP